MERHDKIQSFKPETYWILQAKVGPQLSQTHFYHLTQQNTKSKAVPWFDAQVFKGKDSPLTLDWSRVRVFDREVGQMFVNLAKTSKDAKVGATLYYHYNSYDFVRLSLAPEADVVALR